MLLLLTRNILYRKQFRTTNMSNYTLTYKKDKSQDIYIEKIGQEQNLYFQQEYDEARKLIKEIISLQGVVADKMNKTKKENIIKYGCNNRVLFTGQRGCGKTSVMHSLADYLFEHKIIIKNSNENEDDTKVKCCCLPMVDPSHFDNNNNILLTVITSMFSEAKKKMTKDGDKDVTAYREELLKQFEKVFKSLDSIKSELSSYTLESLNRKSDAEDLRDKMNDLVGKYLKYLNAGDDSRLILLIDDIDMSVSHAPEMLEQLRKYLELDNLIILMSANLGQLSNEMREKYSSAFQYTLKDSNQALSIDVEDLATKYLLKLFPTSRRINVERLDSQLLETDLQGVIDTEATDKNKPQGNFQKVILSLIWSKTRLLFIPKDPENTLHPIIPTNLRDLAQFLDMLTSLDVVEPGDNNLFRNDGKSYENCRNNLQTFKNYVIKTWIPNHLKVDEELVFHNIPSDITEINKHLINSINIIGTKHKDDLMSRQVSLDIIERNAENIYIDRDIYTMVSPNDPKFVKANKISDIFNQPSNYSYGDLLLMIDKYETYFESEEHRGFTNAIKIYYSILLFETMFFKSQNVNYDYEEEKEYDVIPIQRLIGGNVYYPNYFEIITDKNFNQKGPSFDAKRAFYHKVKVGRDKKVGHEYPLFAVLYYGDIRPDRYEKDHIYDTTFDKNAEIDGVNYVTFDILSVFNNMLNPCHTLNRLDEKHRDMTKWPYFKTDISEKWGRANKIGTASIPNAILPFYSVDMMLNYLRKDYRVSEICTVSGLDSVKDLADDYYSFFDTVHIENNNGSKGDINGSNGSNSGRDFILGKVIEKIKKYTLCNNEELDKVTFDDMETSLPDALKTISDENQYFDENGIALLKAAVRSNNKNEIRVITSKYSEIAFLEGELLELAAIIDNGITKLLDIKKEKSGMIADLLDGLIKVIKEIGRIDSAHLDQIKQFVLKNDDRERIKRDIKEDDSICEKSTIDKLLVNDVVKNALIDEIKEQKYYQLGILLSKNTLSEKEIIEIETIQKKYHNGSVFSKLVPLTKAPVFTNEEQRKVIAQYIKIICEAYECYNKISGECHDLCSNGIDSIVELYRNRVVALILGMNKQYMSKKEKETLVKEIHKYTTVSEVYYHIVEVLWKNAITEICIRGVIQKKVRSIETVANYYDKLWDVTHESLTNLGEMEVVYRNVYQTAKEIFIK